MISHFVTCWNNLNGKTVDRKVPGTYVIAGVGFLIACMGAWASTRNGTNLFYSDAQSHLTIARRLFDSQNPGFQQLGTVWLPVPHLLLLPFVTNLWLWHTGWAAALLGICCLTATTVSLYRIAARVGLMRRGRLAVVLLFLVNPNILYTYSTALTEPVLITCMLAGIAGLSGWAVHRRPLSAGELAVFAGIPTAGAVLSRYEGWSLVGAGVVFIVVVGWLRGFPLKYIVRSVLGFAWVPFMAMVWWVSYNYALFGNPLEFMFGEYSAAYQQQQISDSGLLASKGSLGVSLATYNHAVLYAAGIVLLIVAGIGVLVWLWGKPGPLSIPGVLIGLLTSSYVFSIVSLYLGQTAINNEHTMPTAWWNNRFALSTLPFLVILAGLAIDKTRKFGKIGVAVTTVVAVAWVGQNVWWMADLSHRSAIMAEAYGSQNANRDSTEVAAWLQENYHGGGILVDETSGGHAVLPEIGIPLSEYVNRSTSELFESALTNPSAYVEYIIVYTGADPTDTGPGDVVFRAMKKNPNSFVMFRKVFETKTQTVYQRVGGAPSGN